MGLDGVWIPDYQAPFSETIELFVALTATLLKTGNMFVGSLVTDVLRRHPMVIAHAFSSLDNMSPGRVKLGLGAGAGTSHTPYGISMSNLRKKLEEGIQIIKLLWAATEETPADFEGRFFSLKKAGIPLKPRAEIPIYVASYGPKMLEITAKFADGWIPESHTPETYKKTLNKLKRLMKNFGRDMSNFEPCLASIFYPFKPNNKAYSRLLSAAKHYLAAYPDILKEAELDLNHPGLRTQHLVADSKLWDNIARIIPTDFADRTIIYGSVENCIEKINEFRKAGCDHIILEPYWIENGRVYEAIKLAGEIKKNLT